MFSARRRTFSSWQSTGDFGLFDNYTRKNDVLLTTSTNEGISNMGDVSGFENEKDIESDSDPIRKLAIDGSGIALFYEPKLILTELEDGE